MFIVIAILCGLPSLLLSIDFVRFIITGKRLYNRGLIRVLEVAGMLILPFLYLLIFDESKNDCCGESAAFSPDHKLTIYILIATCIVAYFYSIFKSNIVSPLVEVFINSMLLFGFVLNVFIAIQAGQTLWLFGNIPVGLLFLFQLMNNHKMFLEFNQSNSSKPVNLFEKISWKILTLNPGSKIPVLFILCWPIFTIITSLILLFAQKPDSIAGIYRYLQARILAA